MKHTVPISFVVKIEKIHYHNYYNCKLFISFYRCKKVYDGVTHAAKLYPSAYLIMILIGTLKGKNRVSLLL